MFTMTWGILRCWERRLRTECWNSAGFSGSWRKEGGVRGAKVLSGSNDRAAAAGEDGEGGRGVKGCREKPVGSLVFF